LEAIDYRTGKIRWSHEYPVRGSGGLGAPGILTTAGHLLFTGDPAGNLIAFDPANGAILWHFHMLSALSNGPMTYELGGQQYLIAGAGDTLYAFKLL
jgi:alcohol dehydrogenase (cytochrome c)